METLQVQTQIRHNAEELSSYLTDIANWEVMMKKASQHSAQERISSQSNKPSLPIRGCGTVPATFVEPTIECSHIENQSTNSIDNLTPATLTNTKSGSKTESVQIPPARGQVVSGDCELQEREVGNEAFHRGDFESAVKAYTRCLGLKVYLL